MHDNDYLKYWRVIKYYYLRKHDMKAADLDMLLFLKSEKYFTKKKFDEFNQLVSWNKKRFTYLLANGWLEVFSKRPKKYETIYKLTHKSKRLLTDIYNKLSGDELSVDPQTNPLFQKNVRYTDKTYRSMIMKMNEFKRLQQRPSQE